MWVHTKINQFKKRSNYLEIGKTMKAQSFVLYFAWSMCAPHINFVFWSGKSQRILWLLTQLFFTSPLCQVWVHADSPFLHRHVPPSVMCTSVYQCRLIDSELLPLFSLLNEYRNADTVLFYVLYIFSILHCFSVDHNA